MVQSAAQKLVRRSPHACLSTQKAFDRTPVVSNAA
jgi:hypothetical protein